MIISPQKIKSISDYFNKQIQLTFNFDGKVKKLNCKIIAIRIDEQQILISPLVQNSDDILICWDLPNPERLQIHIRQVWGTKSVLKVLTNDEIANLPTSLGLYVDTDEIYSIVIYEFADIIEQINNELNNA